ncbi:MAG: hypothetical protein HUU25_04135 [Candidatus Sumerlaeia bacterium]|nr:hypothetical protein [Candidatus Sumerlaeia bacterium]
MASESKVWVAQGVHCPICRGKHDLCFSHEPEAEGTYRLSCPVSGQAHDIVLHSEAKPMPACPSGGVSMGPAVDGIE